VSGSFRAQENGTAPCRNRPGRGPLERGRARSCSDRDGSVRCAWRCDECGSRRSDRGVDPTVGAGVGVRALAGQAAAEAEGPREAGRPAVRSVSRCGPAALLSVAELLLAPESDFERCGAIHVRPPFPGRMVRPVGDAILRSWRPLGTCRRWSSGMDEGARPGYVIRRARSGSERGLAGSWGDPPRRVGAAPGRKLDVARRGATDSDEGASDLVAGRPSDATTAWVRALPGRGRSWGERPAGERPRPTGGRSIPPG
jgi:hypothetical protein